MFPEVIRGMDARQRYAMARELRLPMLSSEFWCSLKKTKTKESVFRTIEIVTHPNIKYSLRLRNWYP